MKQSNTQTAAIYCRVAVKDDLAIDFQQQRLKQFSNGLGYDNHVYYTDNGASGTTLNRPALAELVSDIEKGEVKTIIVKSISRIGRRLVDVMKWLDKCRKANVKVIFMADTENPFLEQSYNDALAAALAKGGCRR